MCDALFSRVGTSDSLEFNSSTFTLEMKEMSYILANVGPNSLVILDELGRGTAAAEGAAICWAICERLASQLPSTFTFLATHFAILPSMQKVYHNIKK